MISPARSSVPRLVAVTTAVPPHRIDQAEAKALIVRLYGDRLGPEHRLFDVFDHSGIETRHACMPLGWYGERHDFGVANRLYLQHALELAERAASAALDRAGLAPADVDHVVFVSSTGVATPSLDARLANRLGFRSDTRRTPLWGLGCAGGAAGVSHARSFAAADPRARVLLVTLELCSLAFQRGDLDARNLVASALFSDGAAAAVIVGSEVPVAAATPAGIELVASGSTLWPETLDVMGWDVDQDGLHVVFSRDIPTLIRREVRADLDAFLDRHGVTRSDLVAIVAHPGGPKVLAAYAETLGLPEGALDHAREVLRRFGNMSSPTCLFVLERTLAHGGLRPGALGLLAALGPGFASEYVLLRGAAA